jgi:hypothetical protein
MGAAALLRNNLLIYGLDGIIIAKSRNLSEQAVRALVQAHVQRRQFGILGEPRVNVLELNLALDQQSRAK